MKTFVCLLVAIFIAATVAEDNDKETCSPWLGYCRIYEDCCRGLECSSYISKCTPVSGLIIPGKDKRPIGPGPFPPTVTYN